MRKTIRKMLLSDSGQDIAEYAVMLALEDLQRKPSPARKSKRIDCELHMGMGFFPCFRLIVQDM